MINFQFVPEQTTLHCNFSGRMDSPASMEAEKIVLQKLAELTAKTEAQELNIVFNLTDVDYIASAFIKICIQAAKSTERGKFSIINTNPFVMKIFKMAGLDKELNVS